MFRQVTDLFGITVDVDLDVMRPNQSLYPLTARLMTGIDTCLSTTPADLALVQGDTTTVLVSALACFYRRIPVGHVEAGLRTGDIWSPFPEEANRRLATPLVTLLWPRLSRRDRRYSTSTCRHRELPSQEIPSSMRCSWRLPGKRATSKFGRPSTRRSRRFWGRERQRPRLFSSPDIGVKISVGDSTRFAMGSRDWRGHFPTTVLLTRST